MKTTDLHTGLLTDHNVGISYILQNNPEAVAERLRSLDFTINNNDDAIDALNTLAQDGDWPHIKYVLSVPMHLPNMSADEVLVVKNAAQAFQRQSNRFAQ